MSDQMEKVEEVADAKREVRRRMERERCRASNSHSDQLALRYAERGFGVDHVQRFSGVDRKVAILLVLG